MERAIPWYPGWYILCSSVFFPYTIQRYSCTVSTSSPRRDCKSLSLATCPDFSFDPIYAKSLNPSVGTRSFPYDRSVGYRSRWHPLPEPFCAFLGTSHRFTGNDWTGFWRGMGRFRHQNARPRWAQCVTQCNPLNTKHPYRQPAHGVHQHWAHHTKDRTCLAGGHLGNQAEIPQHVLIASLLCGGSPLEA